MTIEAPITKVFHLHPVFLLATAGENKNRVNAGSTQETHLKDPDTESFVSRLTADTFLSPTVPVGGTDHQVPHVRIIFFFQNIQGHVSNQMMPFKLKQRDIYSNNLLSVFLRIRYPTRRHLKPAGTRVDGNSNGINVGKSFHMYCFIVIQIKFSDNFGKAS